MTTRAISRASVLVRTVVVALSLVGSLLLGVVVAHQAKADVNSDAAANWASARVGNTSAAATYDNKCQQFVYDAYASTGVNIGTAGSAVAYWNNHSSLQHPGDTNPPKGALVYWGATTGTYANPDGHVAIALGNGTVVSSYERSDHSIHTFSIASRNSAGYPYLGWIMPPGVSPGGITFPDGSYVRRPNGAVYLMAGNAPFPVYSWQSVGGQKPYTDITDATFNAMPQYPKDGVYVVDYGSPSVYVTAGGAGIPVPSWQSVGGQKPVVTLPASSVGSRLLTVPLDGTYVVDYGSPSVYVIAGGAPFPVGSWESVGGQKPVASLPQSSVGTRFQQYPVNGTAYTVYGSPSVYIAAGGAGLYVTGWDAIGGPRPTTVLPASGVQAVMRSYPLDGTYVRNYANGAVYYVNNGATSHLYSWGPAGPQPTTDVDAWAITNQLHATE